MVYNVKVYIYQKNVFKKRIHQSISVKKGYQGLNIRIQLHVEEVGNQLLQLLLSL
jgi:intein-encoded DNA endonuclease-like protein